MSITKLRPLVWGQPVPESLRSVYEDAFPPEERRAWDQLTTMRMPERVLYLIEHEGAPVGLVVLWELPTAHYIEYLVVDSSLRGGGIGSEVLRQLKFDYDDGLPIVLECEPEGYSPEAGRRLRYYARHGLLPQEIAYRQPPYSEGLPWVDLLLLASEKLSRERLERVIHELHSYVYGRTS